MTIYGATNQPTQATHHGQPEGGKVGDVHTKLCGCAMAGAMQQAGHQAGVAPQDINKAIDALWQAIAGIKQQAGGGAAGGMGGAGDLNQMMQPTWLPVFCLQQTLLRLSIPPSLR